MSLYSRLAVAMSLDATSLYSLIADEMPLYSLVLGFFTFLAVLTVSGFLFPAPRPTVVDGGAHLVPAHGLLPPHGLVPPHCPMALRPTPATEAGLSNAPSTLYIKRSCHRVHMFMRRLTNMLLSLTESTWRLLIYLAVRVCISGFFLLLLDRHFPLNAVGDLFMGFYQFVQTSDPGTDTFHPLAGMYLCTYSPLREYH